MILRPLAILFAGVALAAPLGCSPVSSTRLPDPPGEELRSQFGRVGVTWGASDEPLEGFVPARGSWDGAGRGAVAGLWLDLKITAGLTAGSAAFGQAGPFLAAGFLGLGLGFLPISAAIGSIYGAAAAPDPKVVDAAVDALRHAIEQRDFPRSVAGVIVGRARAVLDDSLEEVPPGASLDGIDTLLVVEAPRLILHGPYNVNPELLLIVEQSASLTRVADRRPLYQVTFVHVLPTKAEFLIWAKDDAALLRKSLETLHGAVGERLLEEMFVVHPLPANREWKKVRS
jgi:hypothetical protein